MIFIIIRYSAQEDLIAATKREPHKVIPPVTSLPTLVVKYFERNFGAASLNIAHQKVIYYLEACLQYADVPLINFFRRCLINDANNTTTAPDLCVWLYVEAKHLLVSRQAIFPGPVIPASGVQEFDDLNTFSGFFYP